MADVKRTFELHTLGEDEARELHTLLVRVDLTTDEPPKLREASWGHLARRTVALFANEGLSGSAGQEDLVELRAVVEGRKTATPAELPSLVRSVLSYSAHWLGRRSRGRSARLEVSGATTADSSASTLRRVFGHSNLVCGQGSERNVATMRRQSGYERQLSFTWHRELTAALPGWRERAGDGLLRDDPAVVAIGDLLEAAVKNGHACIASFGGVGGPPTRRIGKTEDGRVVTMVATEHAGDHIIRGSLLVSGVRVRHEVKERHVWISNSGDSYDVVDSQDSPDAYLSILAASVRPNESVRFDAGSDERGRYFDCRFGKESRGEVYNTVVSLRSSATYRYYPEVPCWVVRVETYCDTST